MREDYTKASLGDADRAMLDYVAKLTKTPWKVYRGDIEILQSNGFDDEAIFEICSITSWFAYYNRIADGLGLNRDS